MKMYVFLNKNIFFANVETLHRSIPVCPQLSRFSTGLVIYPLHTGATGNCPIKALHFFLQLVLWLHGTECQGFHAVLSCAPDTPGIS
jgi:hypothetical protein